MEILAIAMIFFNITFSKFSFGNNIRMSNSLDSDHVGCSVGPDLCPNYLQNHQPASRRQNFLLALKELIYIYIITPCLLEI